MNAFLKVYHCLPPLARDFMASSHGLYLRRWRYGPETALLTAEALDRDKWSVEQWREWQRAKLAHVLRRAVELVPWYRDDWERRRKRGDLQSPTELKNWRILRKEDLRLNPKAFLAADVPISRLRMEHSSGTTGTSLPLWQCQTAARRWYALMEARWRGWYGLSRHDPWAILGGQLVTPVNQRVPPFWVWNAALKQLYLSSYHLSAETCASYFEALRQRQVVYLWGYASSLYSLALFAQDQRLKPPRLKVVISNAELLHTHQRELIKTVFGCPVRDTYGMSEMVAAASECEHGRLHLWPDAGIVEVLADEADEPVPFGTTGRLVCTSLVREAMGLIRYEVGDRGALADPSDRCPCGRALPVLQSIEGRDEDVILTLDGRRIGRLDSVFKAEFPIREAQVVQDSQTSLRLKLVPDVGYSAVWQGRIVQSLLERVGNMAVTVECVDRIPRSPNGKFRAVISQINSPRPSGRGVARPKQVPSLLKAFHALPPFARNWAASLHGYSLKARRYSRDTRRLTEEALLRDKWTAAQWRTWTEEQVTLRLRSAALNVPWYTEWWAERRRRGPVGPVEALSSWPILKKETVRTFPERFLATDSNRRKLHLEHTSGTTGTPLGIYLSQESLTRWYALNEARIKAWNGLDSHHRWGHLGGQPVVPIDQSHPPYWVWNAALKQLYMASMNVGPRSSASYLSAIKEYRLDYLLGYASSLALLAQYAVENHLRIPLKLVLTDSEPLLARQRAQIEEAFGCPVRETYGMAEIICGASECSEGSLHLWPDAGYIELLDERDQPVSPGQTGRIVATGFLNPDMPLIRYDTQDLAQLEPDDRPCRCGRTLPRIRKLLGRNDDVVITKDGRRIVQIDRIFDPCFDIREAQIVQEAIGRFTIKLVAGSRWTGADADALVDALANLVGEAEITIEHVAAIEKTWAGKYRMIVSKIAAQPTRTA